MHTLQDITDNNQRFWWHICKTTQAQAKVKFCKKTPSQCKRQSRNNNEENDRKETMNL